MTETMSGAGLDAQRAVGARRHGEYKIPGGKLVVVDLNIAAGYLCDVRLSGDFFLEPPEALDALDAALNGLPATVSAPEIIAAVNAALAPAVQMYGLSADGIAVVLQRALA